MSSRGAVKTGLVVLLLTLTSSCAQECVDSYDCVGKARDAGIDYTCVKNVCVSGSPFPVEPMPDAGEAPVDAGTTTDAGIMSSMVQVHVTDLGRTAWAGQTVSLHTYVTGATGAVRLQWEQIGGTKVTITGADQPTMTFLAPEPSSGRGELVSFTVRVSDAVGQGGAGKVAVQVFPAQTVLVQATVDARSVTAGSTVSLHAVGTGATTGTYEWTQLQPENPAVTFVNGNTANPTFVAPDVSATFRMQVRYTDGATGRSATDLVEVLVQKPQTQPGTTPLTVDTTDLTPRQALQVLPPQDRYIGTDGGVVSVALDVTGGRQPYTHAWTQVGGPTVTLATPTEAVLSFAAPAVASDSVLSFQDTVTDADNKTVTGVARVRVIATAVPVNAAIRVERKSPVIATAGQPVLLSSRLTAPTVAQTGGPQGTWTVMPNTRGSGSTITFSTPNIMSSAEAAELTTDGADGAGQLVREVFPIAIIRAPGAQPPQMAPPLVPVGTPQLVAELAVTSCGFARADEGQTGVVLGACPTGGTGTYTYSWVYEPIPSVPTVNLTGATTSHPTFTAPAVMGNTVLKFKVTVTSGPRTAESRIFVAVNDLASTLVVGALQDLVVPNGHLVSLSPPTARGGVPPYSWTATQTMGTTVGVSGTTLTFPAPTLAAGAMDSTLAFELKVTDGYGNTAIVTQRVVVKAPPPPLAVSLDGPAAADQGATVSLNAVAVGGTAPYTYSYAVTGGTATIPASANPSFTLPTIAAGGDPLELTITLSVTDSSTPAVTVTSAPIKVQVSAPNKPAANPLAVAAEAVFAQTMLTTKNEQQLAAAAVAAAANLPPELLTAYISPGTEQARAVWDACSGEVGAALGTVGCNDQYLGDCATDFMDMCGECFVPQVCVKSCGACAGITPEMRRLFDERLKVYNDWFAAHPGCLEYMQTGC